MKKKIILITILIINITLIIIGSIKLYNYIRIKNAKIEVILTDTLSLEFTDKKKVSDFISSINGKIIDDYIIDSTKLGKKEIKFKFINEENIKLDYSFYINVVDTVVPLIWINSSYSVKVGNEINIIESVLCGDNYDSNPKCFIEGAYDTNKVGNYDLVFKAIDNSGNETKKEFTLKVYESNISSLNSSNSSNSYSPSYTDFNEVVKNYKNDNTKIGLDVSEWQGEIDFEKIKNAGVEFIFIRVGGTKGTNKDYFLDSTFKQNIENANKYNIPAGIYFFSYANSSKSSIKDAKWVLNQIKGYKIDLPIVFDWEDWSDFNEYNVSFYELTKLATDFIDTIEKAGYKGMLYSSKSYLENIWMPIDDEIWLAHYTKETNYKGNYKVWQLCNNGQIDGIDGFVDINIMYN